MLLLGVVLAAALAHTMELPAKIRLDEDQYFLVQSIYRGWALVGIALIGAVVTTSIWAMLARGRERVLVSAAAACIAGGLGVFLIWTQPANRATDNWTVRPENWDLLRRQWELSHVAGAILYGIAYVLLILALIDPAVRTSKR
jgi:hypothetical protein